VLAANVRRMRIARRLSLSELARMTGASKATLSGIERARANPTVETLALLAGALHIGVGELLVQPPLGEIRVVRATHDDTTARDELSRVVLDSIPAGTSVEIARLALPARHTHELAAQAHGARMHVYVLAGTLIAGPVERPTELASGDYASFPGDVPQAYEATRVPARALLLTHLP